jgi:N-acetyl-anhydromuramoyl-L-alanine amidase
VPSPNSRSSPSAHPHPATGADWQDGSANANHQGWDNGWLRGAHRCPSPNHGPRPQGAALRLVVLHSISLPPGEFGNGCIEQLFTNTLDWDAHPYFQTIRGATVSSHFVIARTGRVTQFVSIWDRAWHAGQSNWHGADNCNDFSIGIELEGLEGSQFEELQYESLVQLSAQLLKALPSIEGFAGHEHIAPGRKQDPGAGFDWTRLIGGVDALAPGLSWPSQA